MINTQKVREYGFSGLPLPLVKINAIEKMLARHATGSLSEVRLIVAIIGQAIVDCRAGSTSDRRTACAFLRGRGLESWADLIGLNPAFVREVAIKTNYLPEESEKPLHITPTTHPSGRAHAGL